MGFQVEAAYPSLSILGVYFANEMADDLCRPRFLEAFADTLRGSVVLVGLSAAGLATSPLDCWQVVLWLPAS